MSRARLQGLPGGLGSEVEVDLASTSGWTSKILSFDPDVGSWVEEDVSLRFCRSDHALVEVRHDLHDCLLSISHLVVFHVLLIHVPFDTWMLDTPLFASHANMHMCVCEIPYGLERKIPHEVEGIRMSA